MSPESSADLYARLRASGRLPIRHAPSLDVHPVGAPLAWDRVEGMLLGLAIGDALGNTSESVVPADRLLSLGEVRDYQPNRTMGRRRLGTPSDDSQMAFWTLEQALEHGALDVERLARVFASRHIVGIGQTVSAFRLAIQAGDAWEDAGVRSAGNGALMRIAPVLVPHVATPSNALWRDVVLASKLTHHDTASVASCVAFVHVLWQALQMTTPPSPDWWSDTFLTVLDDLCLDDVYRPRGGTVDSGGRFPDLVRTGLERARRERWNTQTACSQFFSSAYLLETVPCVLWILEQHAADPEEAIVRAVNDTYDNDTIAAIVGAAVGALHGADRLPQRWRDGLTGRTASHDDGRIQALIAEARHRFWETA